MKTLFLFTILLFSHHSLTAAQDTWARVQSDNGEFSIEMPVNCTYFFDPDGFAYETGFGEKYHFAEMQLLNAAAGKTIMSVEIYRTPSPKRHLEELADKQKFNAKKRDDSHSGFDVKTFEQKEFKDSASKKNIEISHTTKFIASKTHIYVVTVANRGAKTPAFERFISSLRLRPVEANQIITGSTQIIKISSLKPTTIGEIAEDASNQPSDGNLSNQPQQPTPSDPAADAGKLLILTKPRAWYPAAARQAMVNGVVQLQVTFAEDGRIPKIGIISGLKGGLNRSAFFSALRMKFIPQEKNGVPETVSKRVEYSFSIF